MTTLHGVKRRIAKLPGQQQEPMVNAIEVWRPGDDDNPPECTEVYTRINGHFKLTYRKGELTDDNSS